MRQHTTHIIKCIYIYIYIKVYIPRVARVAFSALRFASVLFHLFEGFWKRKNETQYLYVTFNEWGKSEMVIKS